MTAIKKPRKVVAKKLVTTDPNKELDPEKTRKIIDKIEEPSTNKIHKVVSLHISVGDEDRDRNMEDFIKLLMIRLGAVPYGKSGIHTTQMGAYYIIDGAVYLPPDYDPKSGIRKGSLPPQWAGGPPPVKAVKKADVSGGKFDTSRLSASEYSQRYHGKGNPNVIKDAPQDVGDDIDWDMSDVGDDSKAKKVASKAVNKAKHILIKKKPSPAPVKRVVRRSKK